MARPVTNVYTEFCFRGFTVEGLVPDTEKCKTLVINNAYAKYTPHHLVCQQVFFGRFLGGFRGRGRFEAAGRLVAGFPRPLARFS